MLGTRKSELFATRWKDVDLARRTLRLTETKAGRPHLLPLPAPAIAMLESLPSRGKSDWVFSEYKRQRTYRRTREILATHP
jgi:integrase